MVVKRQTTGIEITQRIEVTETIKPAYSESPSNFSENIQVAVAAGAETEIKRTEVVKGSLYIFKRAKTFKTPQISAGRTKSERTISI